MQAGGASKQEEGKKGSNRKTEDSQGRQQAPAGRQSERVTVFAVTFEDMYVDESSKT